MVVVFSCCRFMYSSIVFVSVVVFLMWLCSVCMAWLVVVLYMESHTALRVLCVLFFAVCMSCWIVSWCSSCVVSAAFVSASVCS